MTTESIASGGTAAAIEELFDELDMLKMTVAKLTAALAKDPLPLPPDWEWATSSQLAAWLGIGVPALSYLRQKKEAPRGHRVGKEIRHRRGDVEKWLATRAEP